MKTIHHILDTPKFHYSFSHPKNECIFFDIETTGLSPKSASIYLIGAMYFNDSENKWEIIQWFADNYHSEKEILTSFLSFLEQYHFLYHFNGKTFDIPFILNKCELHNLSISNHVSALFEIDSSQEVHPSIDLLAKVRKLKKILNLPKANQTYLEQYLGIHREDEKNGGELISVYTEYMQAKILHKDNVKELEQLLLLHNHDDIACMLPVSSLLNYALLFHNPEKYITEVRFSDENLLSNHLDSLSSITLSFQYDLFLPKDITYTFSFPNSKEETLRNLSGTLTLSHGSGMLTVPVYHGKLKYFFQNYKDYYYLPLEDAVIHKSLASFVDKNHRKKATAATCYVNSEGDFFPSLKSFEQNAEYKTFYIKHRDKLPFFALQEEESISNNKFFQDYLMLQISSL